MPRQSFPMEFMDVEVAKCLVCGCDDLHACPGSCSWHTVDRDKGTGICSNCVGKKPFKKGTRFAVVHTDRSECNATFRHGALKIVVEEHICETWNEAANISAALNQKGACGNAQHKVKPIPPAAKARKRAR